MVGSGSGYAHLPFAVADTRTVTRLVTDAVTFSYRLRTRLHLPHTHTRLRTHVTRVPVYRCTRLRYTATVVRCYLVAFTTPHVWFTFLVLYRLRLRFTFCSTLRLLCGLRCGSHTRFAARLTRLPFTIRFAVKFAVYVLPDYAPHAGSTGSRTVGLRFIAFTLHAHRLRTRTVTRAGYAVTVRYWFYVTLRGSCTVAVTTCGCRFTRDATVWFILLDCYVRYTHCRTARAVLVYVRLYHFATHTAHVLVAYAHRTLQFGCGYHATAFTRFAYTVRGCHLRFVLLPTFYVAWLVRTAVPLRGLLIVRVPHVWRLLPLFTTTATFTVGCLPTHCLPYHGYGLRFYAHTVCGYGYAVTFVTVHRSGFFWFPIHTRCPHTTPACGPLRSTHHTYRSACPAFAFTRLLRCRTFRARFISVYCCRCGYFTVTLHLPPAYVPLVLPVWFYHLLRTLRLPFATAAFGYTRRLFHSCWIGLRSTRLRLFVPIYHRTHILHTPTLRLPAVAYTLCLRYHTCSYRFTAIRYRSHVWFTHRCSAGAVSWIATVPVTLLPHHAHVSALQFTVLLPPVCYAVHRILPAFGYWLVALTTLPTVLLPVCLPVRTRAFTVAVYAVVATPHRSLCRTRLLHFAVAVPFTGFALLRIYHLGSGSLQFTVYYRLRLPSFTVAFLLYVPVRLVPGYTAHTVLRLPWIRGWFTRFCVAVLPPQVCRPFTTFGYSSCRSSLHHTVPGLRCVAARLRWFIRTAPRVRSGYTDFIPAGSAVPTGYGPAHYARSLHLRYRLLFCGYGLVYVIRAFYLLTALPLPLRACGSTTCRTAHAHYFTFTAAVARTRTFIPFAGSRSGSLRYVG